MLSALIFDVDGTLAETEEFHRRAFNVAFMLERLDWFWDKPLYIDLLKVTGGRERILHFIACHLGEPLPEKDALALRLHRTKNRIYAEFVAGGQVPLRPGIAELIAEARAAGLRLAIATTTSPANVEALMASTLGNDWRAVFPIVVAGDMVGAKKPAADVYLRALDDLGLPASSAIAIEDSRNGVLSARAAGLKVVCVTSAFSAGDDLTGASAVFGNPATLTLEALRRIFAEAA